VYLANYSLNLKSIPAIITTKIIELEKQRKIIEDYSENLVSETTQNINLESLKKLINYSNILLLEIKVINICFCSFLISSFIF
jgi:hypothetical protein